MGSQLESSLSLIHKELWGGHCTSELDLRPPSVKTASLCPPQSPCLTSEGQAGVTEDGSLWERVLVSWSCRLSSSGRRCLGHV